MISGAKYKVGDEVEICYNPNDYNDIYNPNDAEKIIDKILIGIGINFILISIVGLIFYSKLI